MHYPETNGQTENANKVMKNYLCAYINHIQDNWVDNLLMAEFAASNHVNMLTKVTPFFADYGFHSQTGIEPPDIHTGEQKAEFLVADKIVKRQSKMMTFLQDQLVWAQDE